jgi:hypothetical protein
MKLLLTLGVGAGCLMLSPMLAHAQTSGQLFFCEGDSRSWTVHESTQPGMFHQEIGLSGPGTFTLTMRADGFGYKGYAYTRPSAWDKWQFAQQTDTGMRTWVQTWRVYKEESRLGLLQLIKDDNACRGCTITMTLATSNCPLISHEEDARNFGLTPSQPRPAKTKPAKTKPECGYDYCYTGETGPLRCVAHVGWDGSQCPF